jgi:hypothetical protein
LGILFADVESPPKSGGPRLSINTRRQICHGPRENVPCLGRCDALRSGNNSLGEAAEIIGNAEVGGNLRDQLVGFGPDRCVDCFWCDEACDLASNAIYRFPVATGNDLDFDDVARADNAGCSIVKIALAGR